MTMHKGPIALMTSAMLLLAVNAPALGGDRFAGPGDKRSEQSGESRKQREAGLLRFRDELQLSADQQSQITAVHEASKEAMQNNRKEMREGRKALRKLMKDGFNEQKVREIADRQGQLLSDQIVMRTRNQSQMREILTEEQRGKMKTLLREHRQQHRERKPR